MKKILISVLFAMILFGVKAKESHAQTVSGNPSYIQVSVTSQTLTLPFDGTRLDWTIHPNACAVKCIGGLLNGQPANQVPTTTFGFEIISNAYLTNWVSPTVSLTCTSESGTCVVDFWIDNNGF